MSNCITHNKEYLNAKTMMYQNVSTVSSIDLYQDGNLKCLIDSVKGKEFGNRFSFYENSYLSSYCFMIDSARASYIETFDSVSHEIISVEGNPIVYKTINADSYHDSLFIQYLITTFPYDNIEFQISDSGREFKSIPISNPSGEYVRLKYLKSINYFKNTKSISRFYVIAKFTGRLKDTKEIKTYTDTIDLSKRIQ